MIAIDDAALPGLCDLTSDTLCRITGAESVKLLRLRYRAGKRAILHLDTQSGPDSRQGALWFFQGGKARRLTRRNKATSIYDPATEAIYQPFPNDHRMPQIRAFLEGYATVAPPLVGAQPSGRPELLRYRPGLSCTFRCAVAGRAPVYVKLVNDDDPARLAGVNRQMTGLLAGTSVAVAPVIGATSALSAISYACAPGVALDVALMQSQSLDPLAQAMDALRQFWRMPLNLDRHTSHATLKERALESADFVTLTSPGCAAAVARVMARLDAAQPEGDSRPIHADIKLEHLFLDGPRSTLIDTECVSFGPPDYDLAQLFGGLWQAEMEGRLPAHLVASAAQELRKAAGSGFQWCLDVVALRLAKFYAQRPSPGTAQRITAILERLA